MMGNRLDIILGDAWYSSGGFSSQCVSVSIVCLFRWSVSFEGYFCEYFFLFNASIKTYT